MGLGVWLRFLLVCSAGPDHLPPPCLLGVPQGTTYMPWNIYIYIYVFSSGEWRGLFETFREPSENNPLFLSSETMRRVGSYHPAPKHEDEDGS